MIEVREIQLGGTAQAAPAMLELRPRWETAEVLVDFIDDALRPAGYRIVGLIDWLAEEARPLGSEGRVGVSSSRARTRH